MNESENDNSSENTKTNKDNLQKLLEHNKHDYIKNHPKTNNKNQEKSTSKSPFKVETAKKQDNDKIKQIISVPTYLIRNKIGQNGYKIKTIQTQNVTIQSIMKIELSHYA